MSIKSFTTTLLLLLIGTLLGWFANKWFNPIQYQTNTTQNKLILPYVLSKVDIKTPSTQIKTNINLNEQINDSLNNNELNKANKLLMLLIKKDPYNTKTLMLTANMHTKLGNYISAFKALEILYNQVQNLYTKQNIKAKIIHLSELYLTKNLTKHNSKDRQIFLQKLTSLLPEEANFHYQLGMLLVDNDDYNGADYQLSYLELNNNWKKESKILKTAILRARQFANGAIEIPLTHISAGWLLKAQINNQTNIQLLLDTGANTTAISDNIISNNDIKNQEHNIIKIHTANGISEAYKIQIENFSIATINDKQFTVAVIANDKLPSGIDGLLGTDWLSRFNFIINQEKPSLILELLRNP